jgi:hypothetical protein
MENEQQKHRGMFAPGNRAGVGARRRTYKTFLERARQDTDRQAGINAVREAIDSLRARLNVLRARQVAPRVSTADKERAAREERLQTARLAALSAELRAWLDEPTPAGKEKPAADPIAALKEKWS